MQLQKLHMRGFTTFVKPIELDFTAMGPGVFAIIGENGSGKTTLLETIGPGILYRNFPARSPSNPADYVDRKRGAEATLHFKHGPLSFKAELKISSKGKQDALISVKKRDKWKVLTTGKLRDYDEQIEKLFGPLRTNMASVFGQQGGGGGFESLKPADRKRLFRWYLGLDTVDEYHKEVKNQLMALDSDAIVALEKKIKSLEADREVATADTAEASSGLTAAEKALDEALAELDDLMASSALTDKAVRYERLSRHAEDLAVREKNLKVALKRLDDEPELVDLDELSSMIDECDEFLEKVDEAVTECDLRVSEYDSCLKAHEDRQHRAGLISTVPCKGEGKCAKCEFLLEAIEAESELKTSTTAVKALKKVAVGAQSHARVMIDKGAEVESQREDAAKKYREGREAEREGIERAKTRAKTEEALSNVQKQFLEAVGEMDELEPDLPFDEDGDVDYSEIATPDDIKAAKRERDAAQKSYNETANTLAGAEAARDVVVKELAVAKDKLKKSEETVKKLAPLRLLEEALGPNGFAIYEIDAAGPEVSGIINVLLGSCYGERFRVAIRTLTPKKSGGFKEDFDFVVRDTKADEDRALGQVSGGEKTIVGEAVRIGFALYQAERGTNFRTMLRDEAEGSLSPQNARRYVNMLVRARELGEFNQIFFVTHSPDAAMCADGVISVDNGKVKFETAAAI